MEKFCVEFQIIKCKYHIKEAYQFSKFAQFEPQCTFFAVIYDNFSSHIPATSASVNLYYIFLYFFLS